MVVVDVMLTAIGSLGGGNGLINKRLGVCPGVVIGAAGLLLEGPQAPEVVGDHGV